MTYILRNLAKMDQVMFEEHLRQCHYVPEVATGFGNLCLFSEYSSTLITNEPCHLGEVTLPSADRISRVLKKTGYQRRLC